MKRILVPLDGSAFGEHAIPIALAVARRAGAEVRLAMVSEPANPTPAFWAEAFLENQTKYLETRVDAARRQAATEVHVSSVLLQGDVDDALIEESRDWEADLVVMSTHGHGGLSRAWLGSVADSVLHASRVPVLLVRPPEEAGDPPKVWEVPSHVIVTVDGTPFAEAAFGPATEFARLFDAQLTVLHVITLPAQISFYLPDTILENHDYITQAETGAAEYLTDVRSRLVSEVPSVSAEAIVSTTPARGVLDAVDLTGAGLIVVASHTHKGVRRFVLGSVADKIVRGGDCPVLVVPGQS